MESIKTYLNKNSTDFETLEIEKIKFISRYAAPNKNGFRFQSPEESRKYEEAVAFVLLCKNLLTSEKRDYYKSEDLVISDFVKNLKQICVNSYENRDDSFDDDECRNSFVAENASEIFNQIKTSFILSNRDFLAAKELGYFPNQCLALPDKTIELAISGIMKHLGIEVNFGNKSYSDLPEGYSAKTNEDFNLLEDIDYLFGQAQLYKIDLERKSSELEKKSEKEFN